MRLLSLDPSSSCIGYAIFDDRRLAEMGRLTPDKSAGGVLSHTLSLRRQLLEILTEQEPDIILAEAMIEKQYTRDPRRTTSLAPCGWAMGVIYGTCLTVAGFRPIEKPRCTVAAVGNQQWTRGSSSRDHKRERKVLTKAQYPQYDPDIDPDGDICDAIMLANWWLAGRERQERLAGL
jgi:hypothetical protein